MSTKVNAKIVTGKRKTAIARAILKVGKGLIIVNGLDYKALAGFGGPFTALMVPD